MHSRVCLNSHLAALLVVQDRSPGEERTCGGQAQEDGQAEAAAQVHRRRYCGSSGHHWHAN